MTLVVALAWPVGRYLANVFEGKPTFLDWLFRPVEKVAYRLGGIRPDQEMSANVYILNFVLFSALGTLFLFLMSFCQSLLPGGPDDRFITTQMTPSLGANTAVSFATTTTWQAYGGETTLRYLVQAIGLVSQNFLAGGAGLAAGIAFIRGFARTNSVTIGNFWVDLVRAVLWVLLPLSLVGAVFLVWQGVPANFAPYTEVQTRQGGTQIIAQGPVACLEFIKNLGTNGGGFFNVNGAHPFANPTPLCNFIGMLAIAVLPASLPIVFGRMASQPKAGKVLLAVMVALNLIGLWVCGHAESSLPPQLSELGVSGGNMEGKEARFGVHDSVLTAVVTSNGATGSYNSMHDSFNPLGVLVLLVNMLIGDVAFGGLGSGLFGLVMNALMGVFLAGLMVGRTPQYLGKTITVAIAKRIALFAVLSAVVVLLLAALAVGTSAGRAGLTTNGGPHGFTEILFAYSSCFANNGQNMAGLDANNLFYNLTTIIAMLVGRFGLAALALNVAGHFAAQRRKPAGAGTLPCDTVSFGVLVLATVLLLGALCFLPALALGPIVEQLQAR
ncbi:MAG TPA: potassium-transporting ATPase subunit KdpA [Gemmataceae bacterium]|nr:potassium-transporting ATPase subunit KdpA [Gemmataceae bacterium]